jgi:tRNA(Ile)-lysidine synthase
MNLNNRFVEYLAEKIGNSASAKYLLAISGGADSMTMLHLFHTAQLSFGVAHCNFSLRGDDSNLDNLLVKNHCQQLNIPFFEVRFDTEKIAHEQQWSIQETARNLRYNWFEKIREEQGFDFIATAHHLDDNVETILFNLVRGTGIKGMKGIPTKNNSVIRPLLFATKQSLLEYAADNQIPYREDTSNLKDTYSRNKIRNRIIPLLKEVNSEAVKHIQDFSEHSHAVSSILEQHMEQLSKQITEYKNEQIIIDCSRILNNNLFGFYLKEILTPYAFNRVQTHAIHQSLQATKSGITFLSNTHELTVNRKTLIVQTKQDVLSPEILVEKTNNTDIPIGTHTYATTVTKAENTGRYEAKNLYMDLDLLHFPLLIRKWKNGDYFTPLGMIGKKKISDFLIDKKVSLPDKKNTFVVLSNNKIVAVLNHQIDDSVKTTSGTRFVFQIMPKKRGTD